MKVLLAEDSLSNQALIRAYVETAGHQVVSADNGQQAIDLFISEMPDLVIMDVIMPIKDGIEAAREIRGICELSDGWIPIIFLSAMTRAEDIASGIDAGGDDYLTKPIDAIVLNAKLRAMQRISEMRHQLEKANHKLKLMAARDGLTGLANRRHFDEIIIKEFKRAVRLKTSLALIICDIDYFKLYNDHCGHQGGDDCLKSLALLMQSAIKRPGDLIARYGGEEFVIILPETDLSGAQGVAETLQNELKMAAIPHPSSPISDIVSLSLGVTSIQPLAGQSIEGTIHALISTADKGLYKAKQQGRNRVVSV